LWWLRFAAQQIGNFTHVFDFSDVACEYIIFGGFYIPFPISMGTVTTIELVVKTVESVRDSKSERTSLVNDTIVCVKL
jgi:hypothetical protein